MSNQTLTFVSHTHWDREWYQPFEEFRVRLVKLVDKLVVELESKLGSNDVTLELDDAARDWIADRGYDPKMGARPMARIIQEHIKRPLAEELLFGSLSDGGHVRISVGEDGNLALNAEPVRKELAHLPKD